MTEAKTQPPTGLWPGPLQWHHELHRRWAGCTLFFWLIRLPKMYELKTFFDELDTYLEKAGARAYATYELSGEFDILLRVWLPESQATGRFADNLEKDLGLEDSSEYQVVEIIRHWVWSGEESHVPEPCDHEELLSEYGLEDIETINRLSDESHRDGNANPSTEEAELAKKMMAANALADLGGTIGIRILIRLEGLKHLKREERNDAVNLVTRELDKLTRKKGSHGEEDQKGAFILDEVSLYRCRDQSLLLLCRVPYAKWHSIREALLRPLAALPGVSQTTTWPALTRNFVRSREWLWLTDETSELLRRTEPEEQKPPEEGQDGDGGVGVEPPPPPTTPPGALEYLDHPEDAEFEAKGSAFTRLDEWLSREIETPEDRFLKESSSFFRDSIAKSVVAMLNSGGGVILIGVLEKDRYENHKSDRLRLRLAKKPAGGRFHVIGLQDPTFRQRGWDGFELKFNRLLKEAVDGEVADLVHISSDFYKGQTLAVVRIDDAEIGEGYYLRDKSKGPPRFMIRRGGSSDELEGSAVTRYIDRRRRAQPGQ